MQPVRALVAADAAGLKPREGSAAQSARIAPVGRQRGLSHRTVSPQEPLNSALISGSPALTP